MILNRGNLKTKGRSNLTAIIQTDKRNVNILPNMHSPSLEDNFWEKDERDVKLAIVQEYITHMGYVEEADWLGSWQSSCSSTFSTLALSTAVIFLPLMYFYCYVYVFLLLYFIYFYCYVYVFLLLYMFCSVYFVFIMPTGTFRLPWLRFFRAFSSVVKQMPGYTSQRQGTARTLPIRQ